MRFRVKATAFPDQVHDISEIDLIRAFHRSSQHLGRLDWWDCQWGCWHSLHEPHLACTGCDASRSSVSFGVHGEWGCWSSVVYRVSSFVFHTHTICQKSRAEAEPCERVWCCWYFVQLTRRTAEHKCLQLDRYTCIYTDSFLWTHRLCWVFISGCMTSVWTLRFNMFLTGKLGFAAGVKIGTAQTNDLLGWVPCFINVYSQGFIEQHSSLFLLNLVFSCHSCFSLTSIPSKPQVKLAATIWLWSCSFVYFQEYFPPFASPNDGQV